jgi:multimeric flavodoxin WrbA
MGGIAMKIALINGSPKAGKNNSGILLQSLESLLGKEHELFHCRAGRQPLAESDYKALCQMDALVLAFPLYVDAIPAHLLEILTKLEDYMKTERTKEVVLYAIVNNGFFEGVQNRIAISILQNWCVRAGVRFGQAIGQGAGEMLESVEKVPHGHGPMKNLHAALDTLAANLQSGRSGESILLSPKFPRVAWRIAGTMFWHSMAKKNGVTKKELRRRLL